jgi:hypothetical protein
MDIKKAAINTDGIKTLLEFSNRPELLGQDSLDGDQVYVPGIWVPGHPHLSEPFSVPIIGDNESTSLTLDWPVKAGIYYKRIAISAMLPAEDFIRGEPLDDDATIYEDIEFDERQEALNEAIDEYTGEWGGFLFAAVTLKEPKKAVGETIAEFIIFESTEEFEITHTLLESGLVSAAEIVGLTRIKALLDQQNAQQAQITGKFNELTAKIM